MTWPVSLPQEPQTGSWRGGPQDNKLAFRPDQGPTITRRRSSAVAHIYGGTFTGLSSTQIATFEAWYEDDLDDGTLSFTWDDPISGTNYSWKFTGETPYSISHVGVDNYMLTVKLMRLP